LDDFIYRLCQRVVNDNLSSINFTNMLRYYL
jgi:hypothetical protein